MCLCCWLEMSLNGDFRGLQLSSNCCESQKSSTHRRLAHNNFEQNLNNCINIYYMAIATIPIVTLHNITTINMQTDDKQLQNSAENSQYKSVIALLSSPQVTPEMLIPYLYRYCDKPVILQTILVKIQGFTDRQLSNWMPIIVHIYLQSNRCQEFENWVLQVAVSTIPLYLTARWSYATYLALKVPAAQQKAEFAEEQLEILRNKLDARLINYISYKSLLGRKLEELSTSQLSSVITKKQVLSNYVYILNNFYDKLFRLPDRLKKYQDGKQRKLQLNRYLQKIVHKFASTHESNYCTKVCFPNNRINRCGRQGQTHSSCLIVKFNIQQCFPFSTRDRIPFKIVFETLSFDDYYKMGKTKRSEPQTKKINSQHNERLSLVFPHSYFGRQWSEVVKQIKEQSFYSTLSSHAVQSWIVKSGDDIRQEHLAMQFMQMFENIFQAEHLKLWVKSYNIIPFNRQSGLIEFIDDTQTISALKAASNEKSLRVIYKQVFGDNWETAITNFTCSLAGYCLFQYIFQVKDRHNNNILIDRLGHIIHIDFSYMICNSPGSLNFQKAPFKFTQDYVQLMEGLDSDIFMHFKFLLYSGIKFLRKYKKQIMQLIEVMRNSQDMKCLLNFEKERMEKRFHEHYLDEELYELVDTLIRQAYSSYSTSNYDRYQWYTNTIHL